MSVNVVLAGGGTAGHTSPLIATAERVRRLSPQARLVCVGTPKGLESRVIPDAGLDLELIPPVPLPRRLRPELAAVPVRLAKAVRCARKILRDAEADVVVGFGGYVALPAYLAAQTMGVPVVLHEQNAVPGLANKVAARFARHVAVTFPGTALPRAEHIGLPMRDAIVTLDRPVARASARAAFGLPADGPVLLVSGGSQGARSINAAAIGALDRLREAGVSVLHVLGPANLTDDVAARESAAYRPVAYVADMAQAYAAADLMVGRSGAGTVMETAVVGLPTIFVPLPHGNGEQAKNARFLVDAGAGVEVADAALDAEVLAGQVLALAGEPRRLEQLGRTARSLVAPDAAEVLARVVVELAGTAR